MTPTDNFSTYYDDLLSGHYDCVDRLILNAYFPMGHDPGGFRAWWRKLTGGDETLDNTHLMRMAGNLSRRLHAYAKAHAIPITHCEPGTRKHEMAEIQLPTDPTFRGVFLILVARAKAPLWDIKRTESTIQNIQRKDSFVNHYYFHIQDPEWGHICIKMCGHPPFPVTFMLNGHEWVERIASNQNLTFTKEGNCFTDTNSWSDLDQFAETLSTTSAIERLIEVIKRWVISSCLIFALDEAEQEQSGFQYAFSCYQLEYSRNLVFKRGTDLDRLFQALIDRTRSTLDVKKILTLFGAKRRPSRHRSSKKSQRSSNPLPRLEISVERPTHDLTIFKCHFGLLTLKIYAKGERVLRVEAIAHNAKALKQGTVLSKLPNLVIALQSMAIRFLDVLRAAHPATLDPESLAALAKPSQRGAARLAGIDLNSLRMRAVLHALCAMGAAPIGFRIQDLADKVCEQTGWNPINYSRRQAAYDLNKVRGKGLITRIGRTHRYQLDLMPASTAYAALLLHEQVLTPVVSLVAHKKSYTEREPQHELDRHYLKLHEALMTTMQAIGIAA